MNTREIMLAMRQRYAPPAWALLQEVGNATGYDANRHADAIAMSLWPSRGLDVHGFEVKASRQDWTKELKNPDKAESIARFCDFWWLVVGDSNIVQPGELPPTWGLLIPNGSGLKVKVEAPRLEAAEMGRPFIAALTRRFAEYEHSLDEVVIKAAVDKAREDWKRLEESSNKHRQQEIDELREAIRKFEEESGVKINRWSYGNIGEAVRFVLNNGREDSATRLKQIRKVAEGIIKRIDGIFEAESPELPFSL